MIDIDIDALRELAWKAKSAPQCKTDCEAWKFCGLCTCGALIFRTEANGEFVRAITPDVVLSLIDAV